MPKARTVSERSMKSKYLSDVRFSSVKGASNWPNCRIAVAPGRERHEVVGRVEVLCATGIVAVEGAPGAKSAPIWK